MTVQKHKTDRVRIFTEIYNEGAHDENLSWQAKGLLWFLLTDPNFREIYQARERDQDAFDSAIDALKVGGYLFELSGSRIWYEVFESKRDARDWLIEASEATVKTLIPIKGAETEVESNSLAIRGES